MSVVFEKTKGLADVKTHYCPGCSHGIVHRLLAECLEEMGEKCVRDVEAVVEGRVPERCVQCSSSFVGEKGA